MFLSLGSLHIYSQGISVKGTVSEAGTGSPLPGVSVVVKNTTKGATTDFDGRFELPDVARGDILVFSYIGFKTMEVVFSGQDTVDVAMEEDTQVLDEVVVIGYGTQAKREVTGAIAVVGSETIEDLKPVRIEQALQGQNAGVQVISSSGSPGSGLNIRIRGVTTNGDNRPLVVVDGNITEGGLELINPNDIESITTLKDASAAIYGTRAANGVILITTKTGKRNTAPSFSYNAFTGFQETSRRLPVLNATEYALYVNEARTNGGESPLFTDIGSLGEGTNWQNEVFETAPISSHDFAVTGGGEKITYGMSVGYTAQDGIVGSGDKSTFNRLNTRLTLGADLTEKLKFNTSLFYTRTYSRAINESGLGSVLFNALNMAPNLPIRDANGDFTLAEGLGNEVINPLAQLANTFNEGFSNKINGTVGLKYQLNDQISAESRLGFNYTVSKGKTFQPIAFFGSGKVFNNDRSNVTESKDDFFDYTWDAFINYENTFAESHYVKVTLGTTVFENTGDFFSATGFDVPNNTYEFADLALTNDNIEDERFTDSQFRESLVSYFTRIQYNYQSKYLFSFSIRRDASSNFGPDNSAAFFPSGSFGWVISEENFLQDNSIIDFFKLRTSYGILGNDRIGANSFRSLLTGEAAYVIGGRLINGDAEGRIPNPQVKWEEQEQFNIGFDTRLWNSSFDITADYFIKTTRDLLLEAPVSGILGASAPGALPPFINAGTVRNSGFELGLGYTKEFSENLRLAVNYNFTTLTNEVLRVNNGFGFVAGGQFGIGQEPPSRFEEGLPAGYFFGLKTDGIFQNQAEVDAHATQPNAKPGELRFVDINGDGQINNLDRTNLGDPIPDISMGLNISLDYKNIDFSIYAFAQMGNEIVRNYERNQPLTNRRIAFLDRWTGPGTSNSFPLATTGPTDTNLFSDFYVEDGDFLRMQTIQLGYSLPGDVTSKIGISRLRLYAQVNNVFTLTKYSGFDPAISSGAPIGGGIDPGFYPIPTTYLVGVNLNF